MKPTPTLDRIEQLVNETPGLSGAEISELLDGRHISNELLRLVQKGRLTRTPKGKGYVYHPAPPAADIILVEPADKPAGQAEEPVATPPVEGIKRIEIGGRRLVRAKQPSEYCNRDLLTLYRDIVNELKGRGYLVNNPNITFHKVIEFNRI